MKLRLARVCALMMAAACMALALNGAQASERTENFDADPGWDGHNNQIPGSQSVTQDFGFSAGTSNAGGATGEIGGLIFPAGEPAYYGKPIAPVTFNDSLTASGKVTVGVGGGHTLVGFFNSATANEWRMANSLVLRFYGRGAGFHAYVEYGTSLWRAGGGSFPDGGNDKLFTSGVPHTWSLQYDPANGGTFAFALDSDLTTGTLSAGHQADGATFDRFGLVNVIKSYDGSGQLWLDDVTINGALHDFSADPNWEGLDNRRTYTTNVVRPFFNFGFQPSQYAGGLAAGEMGGLVFRGDCRDAAKMAYYGDRLDPLTLDDPLHASGKVAFRQGVSDSTTLIGFFHSTESITVSTDQNNSWPKDFLGVAIEGPSAEGFFFYPVYRTRAGDSKYAQRSGPPLPPYIYPDALARDWSLDYDPAANGALGRMTVTLGGNSITLDLDAGHRASGADFDRFGLVTTWIDGAGQHVYFDDLTYTSAPDINGVRGEAWLHY